MREKIVGVIGGMGPEATVDLMNRVLRATPAADDRDHIRMVVDNNPKVPSRIAAIIEGKGENPVPCLREMAKKLAAWGVDFLVIPCNTAHFYYDDIRSAVDIPLLNMIDLTIERMTNDNPQLNRAGLLASTAVIMTELYMKPLKEKGISLIHPSTPLQDQLFACIRKIKAGKYHDEERHILQSAARDLADRGAEALIVACTELSIISDAIEDDIKLYDASQILAENIVRMAKA